MLGLVARSHRAELPPALYSVIGQRPERSVTLPCHVRTHWTANESEVML
jgi:hypothetical protein